MTGAWGDDGRDDLEEIEEKKMSRDELGDRMKSYEALQTAHCFDKSLPIYARIDGRSFSSFTNKMQRPFDRRMLDCMNLTLCDLVEKTNPIIGYHQSDEISLLWHYEKPETEAFFGGKIFKLTSVLASLTTALFIKNLQDCFTDAAHLYTLKAPHFDCRVFQLPDKWEAVNAFVWRNQDCKKNAISMIAQQYFSSKELHGCDQAKMKEKLSNIRVDVDNYPTEFLWGTFAKRISYEREPGLVRSMTHTFSIPDFSKREDKMEIIYSKPADLVSLKKEA